MEALDRLVVALDRSKREDILRIADDLAGAAGWMKLGLQAFVSNGPEIVREIASRGHRVFLDLKFHDIPNTAANAVAEAVKLGAAMTNVHASGGSAMLKACREKVSGSGVILLAVTVLTSLSDDDLREVGFEGDAAGNVIRLAKLAKECGLAGVVASAQEIAQIRGACGEDFVILTPGIRGRDDAAGDQKRTLTAAEAVSRGATYIVVGRPITEAPSQRTAALRFVEEIAAAKC